MGTEAAIRGTGAQEACALEELEAFLGRFSTLSLDEAKAVQLMKRHDTKFILPQSQLLSFLGLLSAGHRLLEVNSCRCPRYRTLYFDTQDHRLHRSHHNGELPRDKWRQRFYLESGEGFLEKKTKSNRGETQKERLALEGGQMGLDAAQLEWIEERGGGPKGSLLPSLWSRFRRITLVDISCHERLTIDVELGWALPGRLVGECLVPADWLPESRGRCVVELKSREPWRRAACSSALEAMRLQPQSWSKYALGLSMLDPTVKKNLFKSRLGQRARTV